MKFTQKILNGATKPSVENDDVVVDQDTINGAPAEVPPQVVPVSETGEVTPVQVDGIVSGDPVEAAAEVVAIDDAGQTVSEVIADAEATGEVVAETDVTGDTDVPPTDGDPIVDDTSPVVDDVPPADDVVPVEGDVPPADGDAPVDDAPPADDTGEPSDDVIPPADDDVPPSDDTDVPPSDDTDVPPADDAEISTDVTDSDVADDEDDDDEDYDLEEEGEVLNDALDTYPEVANVLADSLETGGVSNEAMRLIDIFARRDGVDIGFNVSLESATTYNNVAYARSKVALEGIGEKINQWKKQLIEWLRKIAAMIRDFAKEKFTQAGRITARADAILANDNITVKESVPAFGSARFLTVGGSVPADFAKVLGGFKQDAQHIGNALLVNTLNDLTGIFKELNSGLIDDIMGKADFNAEEGATIARDKSNDLMRTIGAVLRNKDSENGLTSDVLPGEAKFVITGSAVYELRFEVEYSNEKVEGNLPALSPEDVKSIANSSREIVAAFAKSKGSIAQFDKSIDDVSKKIDHAFFLAGSNDRSDGEGYSNSDAVYYLRNLVSSIAQFGSSVVTKTSKYYVNLASASLDYAENAQGKPSAPAAAV